ncbi:MAG TPA: pitrilysin family protein [Anaeromyxobacteraceae bacterium]|nr:pitrilysin family protein [Anaeromyxobacteraceae bacterium]
MVIVRDPIAPVVTTEVSYLVGSNEAPAGFPGLAHAQEHMMFRGSPELSAEELASVIAAMGGQFNAYTQQTVTQYFLTVPAEDLDAALRVEAIRMSGVLDSEELWAEERAAIEQEVVQDLSSPQYVFYTRLLAALFKGTPYEHDALGTKASFDKITAAMLKSFYDTWYAPNNAILVVVGDVDPEAALALVSDRFGAIPGKAVPARPRVQLSPVEPEMLRLRTDLPYGLAAMSFRMPGTDSADYAAAQVLGDVLSSQRGGLYGLVPRGKALYAGFSTDWLPAGGVGSAVAAFPRGADSEGLLQEIGEILRESLTKGISPDLVAAAKRRELADFEFQRNSVAGLAQIWSQALAVEGRRSPEDSVREIERVTVDDVNRVARRYLDPKHAILAILTPESSGGPIAAKGFGGAEALATTSRGKGEMPAWAEKALGEPRVPASTVHPTVHKLANGLTLIVQHESISNTVSVYGSVRNEPDLETPDGKDGVDDVLGQLFSFGTTSLDRLAFQEALDDLGAEESAGVEFSLRVLAANFERGLDLLADNLLHPALPPADFKVVQGQTARAGAGLLESPDYLTERALSAALFPSDDPTQRQATPSTVSSLTYEDVKAYYRKVLRPDLTTIVVIGNVDDARVEAAVRSAFGSWRSEGPKPRTVLPTVPLNRPSVAVLPDQSRVQDDVTLAETLDLTRSDPDYYALELGNHVLGGAFYASRLYRDLREKGGLVYSVDSRFDVDQTRAVYSVQFGCDPRNVSEARAIVVRNLEAMQREPVTAAELHNARALALREIPLAESSVRRIALGLLDRAQHDLPLDEPTLAARRYLTMGAEEIRAAFARRLRPHDMVQVTQGPAPR